MNETQVKDAIEAFAEALRRTGVSMSLAGLYCQWLDDPDAAKARLDGFAAQDLRKLQAFAAWLVSSVPAAAGRLLADTSRNSGRRNAGLPSPETP